MVHVRFINDQETVVTVPVRPDVDRWVLAVMPVKIKLELLRDTLCVNGGRDTDAAFTQHEQDRFVHIVVDKHDRTPGRLYQIGGELVRIENLAVIKNAFDRGQGSTHRHYPYVPKWNMCYLYQVRRFCKCCSNVW